MISVVVPVYNVENYLEACLESILASTYTDFELIVIDDGSTDSSGRLCDQVAARDQRVKVVHQENSGIAASRNLGIEMSSGEYLSFVDADDVVAPDMLERLLEALVADPECDFSMGRASTIHDDESMTPKPSVGKPEVHTYSQEQYLDSLFRGNLFGFPVVWCKLFRREFIGQERFKPIQAEDIEWLTRLCIVMQKAAIVEQPVYGYRVHSDSATHGNSGVNPVIVKRLDTLLMCLDDIPQECPKYRSWCLLYIYKVMLNTRYIARSTSFAPEVKASINSIYNQTVKELMQCQLKPAARWGLYGFYHLPWLYAIAYPVYVKYYQMSHGEQAA